MLGFVNSKPPSAIQPNIALNISSRRHSNSNFFLNDSPQLIDHTEPQQSPGSKCEKSTLRTSSSLISLLPPNSQLTPHFWHCSHHTSSSSLSPPSSVDKVKRISSNVSNKIRTNLCQSQLNGKICTRKSSKSISSNSSSSSSTKSECDDQQVPQTRSILRHSCVTKYNTYQGPRQQLKSTSNEDRKELDYRKRTNYDLSSHSDSESSDITNSSGDSNDCSNPVSAKTWQSKRRNSHKVCFVDEIVHHQTTKNESRKCSLKLIQLP